MKEGGNREELDGNLWNLWKNVARDAMVLLLGWRKGVVAKECGQCKEINSPLDCIEWNAALSTSLF